jgi:tetratricopeptide (TPR) repeat protein
MFTSEKMLNEFYQGLKLLIEFETGHSHGAMSSQFCAINKVVAHFNTALDEGDVIAPFFLHYLADKFPAYVDKLELPDLSSVPSHKSNAQIWIKEYQTFLNLYEKIDEITKPRVIECSSTRQVVLNQKKLQTQLQRVQTQVANLMNSTSSLGGVLAAKLLEHLQDKTSNKQFGKLCVAAFESSAFYPNVYAMFEYARFLHKKGMGATIPEKQKKLETELNLLLESNGDINILVEHYQTAENNRFLSQWLFQSAIHGRVEMAKFMLERYIFDEHMQWNDKISNKDKLAEAIKWFNWYEEHAPWSAIHTHWREITQIASNYREVIGDDKYKASFLCYALDRINQKLHEQSKTISSEEFLSQNMDLAEGLQNLRAIVDLTWSLNNSRLPSECSSIVINEMATILEARHEYKQAECLYRRVYALDGNHPIHQYNLANILSLQNKNKTEQISLYFDAARQGCGDSIQYLFKLLVIDGEGSFEHLEKLKHMIESLDFNVDLPIPKKLVINLISMTIFQKLTDTEIIKWIAIEKNGKVFFDPQFFFEKEKLDETDGSEDSDKFSVEASESCGSSSGSSIISSASSSSSISPTSTDKITAVPTELKEKRKEASSSASSFRLFQPAKNEPHPLDARKERALRTLNDLNSKQIKSLSVKDFIQAKKAYQILMGEAEGIEISRKGKTSGSRAKVGDTNMHLTHGRDRMSIGAQSEIKEAINGFCWKIGHSG